MDQKKFAELIEFCKEETVYIQTHNFPDPDAIASAYGLKKILEYYQIPSVLCYYGKIDKLNTKRLTEMFAIDMCSYEEIEGIMTENSPIICVDSQKNGGNILNFRGQEIACIDHHPEIENNRYQYCDIRMAGSCATLISEYFKDLSIPMDSDTATILLYGLKMDTLQFSRGVTPLDIEMFQFLFARTSTEKEAALERNTMELNDLKAYGAAIEHIEIFEKVGFAYIPFSCPNALIAIISDFILKLNEVEAAVVYSYRSDGIKFSVRAENPGIHAGKVVYEALQEYGNGGGHSFMAGGLIETENVPRLGQYPDAVIKELFLKEILKGK